MTRFRKIIFPLICTSLLTVVVLFACTKDKTPKPVEPCDPNKIYFQRDIQPLINSNCAKSGCHDAITRTEGLNLTTYDGVMKIVRPGRPSNSDLIEVINETDPDDRMPPPPNTPLTQEQKNLLSRLISEGATNEICAQDAGGCDSAVVSYSNDISKIINTNCIGCHSGSTISGGVNLSSYSGVKVVAASGKLYNAVAQNGLATPMPPSQKLSTCDIQRIKRWVDAGSPNN